MVYAHAIFNKSNVAHLADKDEGSLELSRRRSDIYELTIFWRTEDISFEMSKAELKALGQALVRLSEVTFIDG